MRAFRFLLVTAGLLLLLTACSSSPDGATGSGSVRSVSREGKSSVSSRASSRPSSSAGSSSSSSHPSNFLRGSSSSSLLSSAGHPPFFSLQASSSSSVSLPSLSTSSASSAIVYVLPGASSSVASQDAFAGRVKIHVDADRGEARAGDQLSYIVTVKNTSDAALPSFQVTYGFSPAQLSIQESDGLNAPGSVQWTVADLLPGQKRALRFRAQLASTLSPGTRVSGTALAIVDGTPEPEASTSVVSVISALPTTGLGDGTLPLENTRRFLTPFHGGSGLPAIVWASTLAVGLALGAGAVKKLF